MAKRRIADVRLCDGGVGQSQRVAPLPEPGLPHCSAALRTSLPGLVVLTY
jgi:hypothetical protein